MTGKSKEVASRMQCCDREFEKKNKMFTFWKKEYYVRNVSLRITQPLRVLSDFSSTVSALKATLRYGTYTIK